MIYRELSERIPKCTHSKNVKLSESLIVILSSIEHETGRTLEFTSGIRCEECNKKVGGSPTSEHITGHAVDIAIHNSQERLEVVREAVKTRCGRLGVGKGFVHVGVSTTHPQHVLWVY